MNIKSMIEMIAEGILTDEGCYSIAKEILEKMKEDTRTTYPMTDKRKEIQMDCRDEECVYYLPDGDCDGPAPAITLNPNGRYVCWSKAKEKEYMYLYVDAPDRKRIEYLGCLLMEHKHRIDLQHIIDVQDDDAKPRLYMSTESPKEDPK